MGVADQIRPQFWFTPMKVTLIRCSRFLHKWLGIYIAALTILWLFELLILPWVYKVQPIENFSGQPAAHTSIQQVLSAVNSGVYGTPKDLELRYHPKTRRYNIVNEKDFTILTIDAATGKILTKELDHNALFSKKSGLGWISQILSAFLKSFFQIFFVILSITGLHLILFRKKPHKYF
ncbi:MAG: hypothetical protein CSA20_03215 [Deltaproteobacteria bacterium]|nr:MAG: hypothetical protein CSA20_03215 [Deltaproteobacteria bacterium]